MADVDRRVRRTRTALHEALLALMAEKGYDAVTVQDIIDRADVGRSTFYNHFTDKRDLMQSGFDDLGAVLARPGRSPARRHRLFRFSLAMFEHTHEQQHLVRALVSRSGSSPVHERLHEILGETVRVELDAVVARSPGARQPDDLIVAYVVGAFLAVVASWLSTAPEKTPEEIDGLFHTLVAPGTRAALHLDSPGPGR